jgi:hypothetical protein
MSIETLTSISDYKALASSKKVLFFYADWHEQSKKGGQMHQVFKALSSKHSGLRFFIIEVCHFIVEKGFE